MPRLRPRPTPRSRLRAATGAWRLESGPRTVFIAVLLLIALGLTIGVGWQAHDATRSHRETAEAVLEDYASLAAGEVIRRSFAVYLRTYNYRLRLAVTRAVDSRGDREPLPAPEDLPTEGREELARIFGLAQALFRYRLGDAESLELAGEPLSEAEWLWLQCAVEQHAPLFPQHNLPYLVLYGPSETPLMAFYWADGETDDEDRLLPGSRVLGVVISRQRMQRVFEDALDQGPVLPPALTEGEVGNEEVRITVRDWTGTDVFHSRARLRAYQIPAAEQGFGDAYDGILDGWTVRAEIAPAAASRLVIGGLPRSRLPTLLALLVLTAGLVAAALWLLTRERELTRLRSDFVSRVSHELRTPLTQIRMFAETLLLDRVRSPEERRRSLEIVDAEAKRLSHLVENILQLSRSERGALQVTPERLDLSRALGHLLSELEPMVASGHLGDGAVGGDGVRLETDIEAGISARVDPDALRQIVLNLLDNAAKYGARVVSPGNGAAPGRESEEGAEGAEGVEGTEGGPAEVRLSLERRGRWARIVVADDGPGVPRRERERIWQRFHRLDRDTAKTGTGIGLAVVRELVLAHDGGTWVEGGQPGARFVVELPIEPAGEARQGET